MLNIADLILRSASSEMPALVADDRRLSYSDLAVLVQRCASALASLGLERQDRVAVFAEKRVETVVALFGAAAAAGVIVPVNPVLKPKQVAHIVSDSGARVLITTAMRYALMSQLVLRQHGLEYVLLMDVDPGSLSTSDPGAPQLLSLPSLLSMAEVGVAHPRVIDEDLAAILYTSGSTGAPKGVMVSHRNLIAGATSVATYLDNRPSDRILCALPLSFDAGFSQLTTAFFAGATAILHNLMLPKDAALVCAKESITGITGVPPMWVRLLTAEWPEAARASLRYFANTGGHLARPTLHALRQLFPIAEPFLMYGLTEAFRSTYLPPSEVERRPSSIGRAIPNARVLVVDSDGEPCKPGEPGELVHVGATVSMGYWGAPELTRQRIRPIVDRDCAGAPVRAAVWSGDLVRSDEDGFLYFIGRKDDMIKSSGYRISPTEIEEVVLGVPGVLEAVALGVPCPELGERIAVVAVTTSRLDVELIRQHCRQELPTYMVPSQFHRVAESLPRNMNGKFDRGAIRLRLTQLLGEELGAHA